jgi:glyoxylase-like metal-dependent hydrolase (beta-lactamase superfamily II)
MKDDRPELWQSLQDIKIRLPDTAFENELKLGNNNEVTVKLLGGHTSGSSIVISENHNTVFVGDLIFNGLFPYAGDPTCDPERWILALEEIHSLGYKHMIPGHGPCGGLIEVANYVEALSDFRDSVKEALKTGLTPDSYIAREMVPKSLREGFERFADYSLPHWFQFYG